MRAGFEQSHIRRSHHYLRKPGLTALVVVPVHGNRTLPVGTLLSIVRQTGFSDEEFAGLL